MKKKLSFTTLIVLCMLLMGCPPPDDSPYYDEPQDNKGRAFGTWEIIDGTLGYGPSKYVYINQDKTINILSETEMGFRQIETTNVQVTNDQMILYGSVYNYSVYEDILVIDKPSSTGQVTLERINDGPEASTFVNQISILSHDDAGWTRDVDITFDGTYILGWHSDENTLLKINPSDFSVADQIPTSHSAYAVEMEKSNGDYRQLFQSNNGFDYFDAYIYRTNDHYYQSEPLGVWIRGIASIEPQLLWLGSQNTQKLYKYKSNGSLTPGEILETVDLDIQPLGLDYQDDYLYITYGSYVYKCQVNTEFRILEAHQLPGHDISGIAFDGTHFWLATYSHNDRNLQLVKTDIGV